MHPLQRGISAIFLAIAILAITVALAAGYFTYYLDLKKTKQASINSFEDCAKLYPVMESYPEQCNTPDGKHFTRQLSNEEREKVAPLKTTNYTEGSIRDCGDLLRDDFEISFGHYSIISGPMWSSDCKYGVLAVWTSGTGPYSENLIVSESTVIDSKDGIYLYTPGSNSVKQIYVNNQGETIVLKGWMDNQNIVYEINAERLYLMDINNLKTKLYSQ
jgi:hypothetical protein